MKKLGNFFVYAALLLVLGIAGCAFDVPLNTGTADDPALPPPPEGQVWVKIPLPQDGDRALAGDNKNSMFIDSYEVYFKSDSPELLFSGKAKRGEVLAAAVVPNVTYRVLILAGDSVTRTLIASAYTEARIVSGQVNQVNLTLEYVESDVFNATNTDFKFTHFDVDTADAVAAAGGWEVSKELTVTSGGTSGYAVNDLLSATIADTTHNEEDLRTVYIRVTEVSSGVITKAEVVQGGRWAANPSSYTKTIAEVKCAGTPVGTPVFSFSFIDPDSTTIVGDIPKDIPWITYAVSSTGSTRSKPITFKITTRNLASVIAAEGGGATLNLAKATIKLSPLYKNGYTNFQEASGTGTLAADADTGNITVTYSIAAADLPIFSNLGNDGSYGILYYTADYSPFGKGKTWSIRNGININQLDNIEQATGIAGGTGILVKIGNPGIFTDGQVDVSVSSD
jgi:hypothetical protein